MKNKTWNVSRFIHNFRFYWKKTWNLSRSIFFKLSNVTFTLENNGIGKKRVFFLLFSTLCLGQKISRSPPFILKLPCLNFRKKKIQNIVLIHYRKTEVWGVRITCIIKIWFVRNPLHAIQTCTRPVFCLKLLCLYNQASCGNRWWLLHLLSSVTRHHKWDHSNHVAITSIKLQL